MRFVLFSGRRALATVLLVPVMALSFALPAHPACAMPDARFPVGSMAYVLLDNLIVAAQPAYGAPIVGHLPHGAVVTVTGEPHGSTAAPGIPSRP